MFLFLLKLRRRIDFQQFFGEGYGHLVVQTSPDSHEEKKFFDFSIDGGNTIPVDLDDCEITKERFPVGGLSIGLTVELRRWEAEKS